MSQFTLGQAIFEIQACRKWEMQRMTQNYFNLLTVEYPVYTEHGGPNFTPFRSTVARFSGN